MRVGGRTATSARGSSCLLGVLPGRRSRLRRSPRRPPIRLPPLRRALPPRSSSTASPGARCSGRHPPRAPDGLHHQDHDRAPSSQRARTSAAPSPPPAVAYSSGIGLDPGEHITIKQALAGAPCSRAPRTAAGSLATAMAGSEWAFVGWMNAKASKLGMRDTHYAERDRQLPRPATPLVGATTSPGSAATPCERRFRDIVRRQHADRVLGRRCGMRRCAPTTSCCTSTESGGSIKSLLRSSISRTPPDGLVPASVRQPGPAALVTTRSAELASDWRERPLRRCSQAVVQDRLARAHQGRRDAARRRGLRPALLELPLVREVVGDDGDEAGRTCRRACRELRQRQHGHRRISRCRLETPAPQSSGFHDLAAPAASRGVPNGRLTARYTPEARGRRAPPSAPPARASGVSAPGGR